MAKRGKRVPARRQRTAMDDSLLLQSAESLGRMIGSLQRQLEGASKKALEGARRATDAARERAAAPRTSKKTKSMRATTINGTRVRTTTADVAKRAATTAKKKTSARTRSTSARKSAKVRR